MKVPPEQMSEDGLATLGAEAVMLLASGQFSILAERFGYAIAGEVPAAVAIEQGLAACLGKLGHSKLAADLPAAVTLKHFDSSGTGVRAVVETFVATIEGGEVLVELVVTADGEGHPPRKTPPVWRCPSYWPGWANAGLNGDDLQQAS